ncbi:MAG: hypothetical protein ACLVFC_06935 [Subdoligranulum sp.]
MIAPNYPPEKQKSAMPKRPNVIWVLADQLRAQALSCNGETNICTPILTSWPCVGSTLRRRYPATRCAAPTAAAC